MDVMCIYVLTLGHATKVTYVRPITKRTKIITTDFGGS